MPDWLGFLLLGKVYRGLNYCLFLGLYTATNTFMRSPIVIVLICLSGYFCSAQTFDEQFSVQLTGTVQNNPPLIQLNWVPGVPNSGYLIYRKEFDEQQAWSNPVAAVNADDSTWTDSTAIPGQLYQYHVLRQSSGISGHGYLLSGIEVMHQIDRGRILLVVDTTAIGVANPDLTIYLEDIAREGWEYALIQVDRSDSVTTVKQAIVNAYNQDPVRTKSLGLIGHVPVPYSGNIYPDGHTNHRGAWPADPYYGELTGNWTDFAVNSTSSGVARTINVPGDGKFDQSTIPGDMELEVGRIDFANLSSFTETETQLLERYFKKNHAYRSKGFQPRYRGVVENNFQSFSEGFGQNGIRNFSTLLGKDSVFVSDYDALKTASYLWAYGCGGGNFAGASGIGNQNGFASDSIQAIFTMHFGSYFGDWDHPTNNYLRAALASGTILTNSWAGRPNWFYYPMGMGIPIGYCARLTMNNSSSYHISGSSPRGVHLGFMGDPTLRMYITEAPSNLAISESLTGLQLSWTPPAEPVDGYFLYTATSGVDSFIQVGGLIPTTQFTYSQPVTDSTHRFRLSAVQMLTTPSGSFYNTSPWLEDQILSTLCVPTDTFLECPSDTIIVADTGQCLVIFQYNPPSVVDDCGQNLDSVLAPVLLSGLGPGGAFTVGTQVELYGIPQDSCQFTVSVLDLEAPVAICKDLTVNLDAGGNATIVALQINNFSTDNCQLPSPLAYALSQTQFDTTDIGMNTVVLTVTDGSGNQDTCQATVTVPDPAVGLSNPFATGLLQAFPNPVSGRLNLRLRDDGDCIEEVRLLDLAGRRVFQLHPNGSACQEVTMDLPSLPSGSYLLEVHSWKSMGRKVIILE